MVVKMASAKAEPSPRGKANHIYSVEYYYFDRSDALSRKFVSGVLHTRVYAMISQAGAGEHIFLAPETRRNENTPAI